MRPVARNNTALSLFVVQLIFIVVFALITTYDRTVRARKRQNSKFETDSEPIRQYYGSLHSEERRCWHKLRKRSTLFHLMNLRNERNQTSLRNLFRRNWQKDPVLGMAMIYIQGTLLCAYIGLVVYHPHADAADKHNSVHPAYGGISQEKNILRQQYASENLFTVNDLSYTMLLLLAAAHRPVFQDVHVMVVIGFGFLMVFLRKYGYSSVGFTLLITAVMIQWAMLFQGLFNMDPIDGKIHISINSMLGADVATAAVLISMGAVLGRTTPLQLVLMGIIEIALYSVNVHLCSSQMQSADLGGSMVVHVYGAYFGLAVSRVLGPPPKQHADESSRYGSDILAMIGTTFLWVFWPSFNAVLSMGHSQHRAVLNTYLALAASCVTAMAGSALFGGGGPSDTSASGRFKMVHVQNATLAGGVAVGAVADLMLSPGGALAVGAVAGMVSVVGYAHLQPFLLQRLRLHDTCGVHNLHGMPGILSGIISAIMAAIADDDSYKHSLYKIYPARAPPANSTQFGNILDEFHIEAGVGRGAGMQAGYQVLALVSSVGFGLLGGLITGILLRDDRILRQVSTQDMFGDALHWDVPEDLPTIVTTQRELAVFNAQTNLARGLPGGGDDTGSQRNPANPEKPSGHPTISKVVTSSSVVPSGAQTNSKV